MSALLQEIDEMDISQKVQVMDYLWSSLESSSGAYTPPEWHGQELARRVGTTKSYISKVENGVVTPSVGLFYRFINAIGMRVEVVNPLC